MNITKEIVIEYLRVNLKKLRKGTFTQETLAEKVGVSHSFIRQIENKQSFASIETLIDLANALNCEVSDLLENPNKSLPQTIVDLSKIITEKDEELASYKKKLASAELTPNEKRLLESYRSAEKLQKMAIETMAGFGLDKYPDAEIHQIETESSKIIRKQKSS